MQSFRKFWKITVADDCLVDEKRVVGSKVGGNWVGCQCFLQHILLNLRNVLKTMIMKSSFDQHNFV